MKRPSLFGAALAVLFVTTSCATANGGNGASASYRAAIEAAVASPTRTPAKRARDQYRHPVETLSFLEVAPHHTVLEHNPGTGWYTEILGPLLKEQGRLIVAVPSEFHSTREAIGKMIADPTAFGANTTIVDFEDHSPILVEAGTVDRVLNFRNTEGLIISGAAANAFAGFYKVLKPGGILVVEDHRLPEEADSALEKTSGYLKESTIRRLAETAGFRYVGSSEVNANPKDTRDHPAGVSTLPPVLRLKEVDREKYLAIGESDRMTLKFVKPR